MNITQLYIYPIKSLRPTAVTRSVLTPLGLPYDRQFMLLKVSAGQKDGEARSLTNMHVPDFPEMALFQTDIEYPRTDQEDGGKVIVTYNHSPSSSPDSPSDHSKHREFKRLEVPLKPDVTGLQPLEVTIHGSPTKAYDMGVEYNDWFSACFGYPVVLAYLSGHSRAVMGSLAPAPEKRASPWWDWLRPGGHWNWLNLCSLAFVMIQLIQRLWQEFQKSMPSTTAIVVNILGLGIVLAGAFYYSYYYYSSTRTGKARITFADCAPYLVISETAVADVSARLPDGEEMDHTKFRPNLVVSGAATAFEEDFWSELKISGSGGRARLLLTGNCVRCRSLDVDFATGKKRTDEAGAVLKKLMKDRRVDRGAKYSPVFGRYAFLAPDVTTNIPISVGDSVGVSKLATERTVFDWPGLAT